MKPFSRTFTLYFRLGCAAAALAAAFACDARTPTAPAPALTPVSPRGDESGDAELGSTTLAPSTWWTPVAAVPENQWALVRVSGNWDVTQNPECGDQPPNWPCNSPEHAYSPFDPNYPDSEAGPVRLETESAGSVDALGVRGLGAGGIALTRREFARVVLARSGLINPTVQKYGNTGPSIKSYLLDGSYTVTVTRIASPIRVTEGAAEADGSRTYTVESLYGLQFINPFGSFDPPGAVRWFFVPGENVDPTAPDSDPPWTINECRNLTSCRWTPPGPGRVQVSASVETRRARARSSVRAVCTGAQTFNADCAPPQLLVSCQPDLLVVGNKTTCTASTRPGVEFTVRSWHFSGDSIPATADTAGDLKSWTFPPPVTGRVTVRAVISGVERSATAVLGVACNFLQSVTGDSILDSFEVQKHLRSLWIDTHAGSANPLERGSFLTDGPNGYQVHPYVGASTNCGSSSGRVAWATNDTLVAFVHTHPYSAGPISPCYGNTDPNIVVGDGPSKDVDVPNARQLEQQFNRRISGYVVDSAHVHRFASRLPDAKFDRNLNCQ